MESKAQQVLASTLLMVIFRHRTFSWKVKPENQCHTPNLRIIDLLPGCDGTRFTEAW